MSNHQDIVIRWRPVEEGPKSGTTGARQPAKESDHSPSSVVIGWKRVGGVDGCLPTNQVADTETALAEFESQFARARGYVYLLDQDRDEAISNPDVKEFVKQAAAVTLRPPCLADPHFYSAWMEASFLQKHGILTDHPIDAQGENRIRQLYDKYVERLPSNKNEHGTFHDLTSDTRSEYSSRTFKCYLEGSELLRGLEDGIFAAFVERLRERGVLAEKVKLFEDYRLVLYFGQDIEKGQEVLKVACEFGLNIRGPAQDVFQLNVVDGKVELNFFNSNDGALVTHTPFRLNYRQYSAEAFLANFRKLCLYAGKRPDMPYYTSFVYFIADSTAGQKKLSDDTVKLGIKLAGYPVIVTSHRWRFVEGTTT